jgi:hypothetical protein
VDEWHYTGFWIGNWIYRPEIGFIDHLYTQLGTESNYSATANLHNSQITTASANPFPACYVFTGLSQATASNNGETSATALKCFLNGVSLPTVSFLHRFPYRTDLVAPMSSLYLLGMAHVDNTVHFRMLTISTGTFLPKRSLAATIYSCLLRIWCLATDVISLSVSRPLPRNECSFRAVC